MPGPIELSECIEWHADTAVMRYHFINRERGDQTGLHATECGMPWREYHPVARGADGFTWGARWDSVRHFDYAVVYCNGCGVDRAGWFHDQRTETIRRRQRQANAEQRERQQEETPSPVYTCPECGEERTEEGTCADCERMPCGDCMASYYPDD